MREIVEIDPRDAEIARLHVELAQAKKKIELAEASAKDMLACWNAACNELAQPATEAKPVAWVAAHTSGRVLHFAISDGWRVDCVMTSPEKAYETVPAQPTNGRSTPL